MRVLELWRYPVKSLRGEQLPSGDLTELGVAGDRAYGLRDETTGNILTARREPALLFGSARLDADGAAVITLPDGTETADDVVLSNWLGRPVTLVAAGAEGGVYENPLDAENDADWVSWQGPGHAWHDSPASRVSLLSTGALGDWDLRRFRANVLVDGADEGRFVKRTLRIGGATLTVSKAIPRCVMVTRPQPGLDRDLDVLRSVNHHHGGRLAIGMLVREPGTISVGDEVVDIEATTDQGGPR